MTITANTKNHIHSWKGHSTIPSLHLLSGRKSSCLQTRTKRLILLKQKLECKMAERRMKTIAQLNFFSGRYFVCEYSQTFLVITITVITNSMAITNNILLYIVGPYWLFYYINLHGYNDVTVMENKYWQSCRVC